MEEFKNKKILVVDDEEDVTDLITYHLKAKGFAVQAINNPNLIMGQARSFEPDLVVLDIMMPDLNGIQIGRMIRADQKLARIPIIFVSAKSEESDRIKGLEIGADDYICKPFSPKELVLRIQSIFRRMAESKGVREEKMIQAGNVRMDVERHEVFIADELVELTATEFKLLRLLMEKRGRVQARDHLLLTVWNYETEIETRTVDTHIRRLREKMGDEASLIETVRGVGYRLVERKPDPCST